MKSAIWVCRSWTRAASKELLRGPHSPSSHQHDIAPAKRITAGRCIKISRPCPRSSWWRYSVCSKRWTAHLAVDWLWASWDVGRPMYWCRNQSWTTRHRTTFCRRFSFTGSPPLYRGLVRIVFFSSCSDLPRRLPVWLCAVGIWNSLCTTTSLQFYPAPPPRLFLFPLPFCLAGCGFP